MSNVFNKDIMEWDIFPEYDIIWCDPPWQQKMVNYFETMMVKTSQKKPNNTIVEIIGKLASLSSRNKPIFIEYSIKGSDEVVAIMALQGHFFNGIVETTQENGNPYYILVFNSTGFKPNGKKKGFKIIEDTCENLNFTTVFDPFAGIGKTAKVFIKKGKSYIGSEINTERFNKLKKVVWPEQQ
jgi:hypothetical protein